MPSLEEKKGRRKFRHEMQKRMWKVAARRIGMFARPAQMHEAAKIMTDRYMRQVDHAPAKVIENQGQIIPERQHG
jgi:hypothetical protein